MRVTISLLVCLAFWSCNSVADFDLEDWHKYELENFVVYSDADEDYVAERLTEFLLLRNLINNSLSEEEAKKLVPFTAYLFNSRGEFKQLVSDDNTAGFYTEVQLAPVLVMYKASRRSSIGTQEVLNHEYMHYLIRAMGSHQFPRWYDEGIAEFYSTLTEKKGKLLIGAVPRIRADWLQRGPFSWGGLLPLKDVLEFDPVKANADVYIARHYASAWLLTHYLNLGHLNGFPNRTGQMKQYLNLVGQGISVQEAFDRAFDVSMEELTDELKEYAGRRRLNVMAIPYDEPKLDYTRTPVSAPAMGMKLYELTARQESAQGVAADLLAGGIKAKDPVALGFQALQYIEAEQFEKALAAIDQLTSDPVVAANSEALRMTAQAMFNMAALQPSQMALAEQAMALLEQANTLAPHPMAYMMLTDAYWAHRKYQSAINSAIQLSLMMPSSAYVNFFTGKYMLKAKQYDYAVWYLSKAASWAHDANLVEDAERYLKLAKSRIEEQQVTSTVEH